MEAPLRMRCYEARKDRETDTREARGECLIRRSFEPTRPQGQPRDSENLFNNCLKKQNNLLL